MAFSLDELSAQRDAILRAIRSGALLVTHGDKTVRYRNVGELQIALNGIEDDIAKESGVKAPRVRYFSTTKALG